DRREIDSDISYKWWIKNKSVKYVRFVSMNNIFWSHTGTLRSYYITNMVDIYLQNRFSFIYSYNTEYKLYEKEYYNHKHWYTLGYNTDEWSSAKIDFKHGKNFDRDFYLVEGSAKAKLLEKLAIEYSTSYINFTPDTLNKSTFINILTINYNFSKDLWLKLFVQNSMVDEKFYVYGLFGWRFKPPFGALYLIYSHDEMLLFDENINKKADVFFLKLTYPIGVIN
ncbi:MAG: hypothetical protein KAQ75_07120, partial [Bacteroidales bacterium]|nr:hypothetical protein [Bacteroidales bacterium]